MNADRQTDRPAAFQHTESVADVVFRIVYCTLPLHFNYYIAYPIYVLF